jgi:hypothetical protein
VAAGNFSVMAAILNHAAALAAEHVDHWEIIDYANATKPDVPSGTSRELAEALAKVHARNSPVPLSELHGPIAARGAEVAGTRIHSVRLPGFVVSTEIIFGGVGERLILRHDPGESPDPYVAGTLLAIRKVADVPGVRRGLDSLLFDANTDHYGRPAPVETNPMINFAASTSLRPSWASDCQVWNATACAIAARRNRDQRGQAESRISTTACG